MFNRLARKAFVVAVLGVGVQLTAPTAQAATRSFGCGWCADTCWIAVFACIQGCGSGGSAGCYSPCTSVDGVSYAVGLTCS
jgi:hypothetical protein